jgi:hypothetical protein
MAEQRPLVLISGRVRQLPAGDTTAGATGGPGGPTTVREAVISTSTGVSEMIFTTSGEMVDSDVA